MMSARLDVVSLFISAILKAIPSAVKHKRQIAVATEGHYLVFVDFSNTAGAKKAR